MNHHEPLYGGWRTPIFHVQLDLKMGDLTGLQDVWQYAMHEVASHKYWHWTMWGFDSSQNPHSMSLIIAWDLDVMAQDPIEKNIEPGDWRAISSYILETMNQSKIVAKLEPLCPHLASTPQVHTFYSVGTLVGPLSIYAKPFDVITIRTPCTGVAHDAVDDFVKRLQEDLDRMTNILHVARRSSARRGDIRESFYGIETSIGNGSQSCTFVNVVSWSSEDSMIRVKDPSMKSWASMGNEMSRDWWVQNVECPLRKLKQENSATILLDLAAGYQGDQMPEYGGVVRFLQLSVEQRKAPPREKV